MIKMLNPTRIKKLMCILKGIQSKNDAKQKIKRPETTVLLIHDAAVAKLKYATSAILANTTMNPYGITLDAA